MRAAMAVPTTRKIYVRPALSSATRYAGDTAKLLSRHNHRLYRQGRNYRLRVGLDATSGIGSIEVYALRPDWMVMKGWQKAFEAFMNNSKEELQLLTKKGGKARWQDFRVNHGLDLTDTANSELEGLMFTGLTDVATAVTSGEFLLSQTRTEAGANRTFTWGAATASQFNILAEYEKMGNTSGDPSPSVTQAAYEGLDDDVQNTQITHLSDHGNTPPYDQSSLESTTPWIKVATLGKGPNADVLSSGYFDAPCGLFMLKVNTPPSDVHGEIFIEAQAGTYKGVASESMGTAKLVKNHYRVS